MGRELSRLLMEQSTQEQTRHMPEDALDVDSQRASQPIGLSKRPAPLHFAVGHVIGHDPALGGEGKDSVVMKSDGPAEIAES